MFCAGGKVDFLKIAVNLCGTMPEEHMVTALETLSDIDITFFFLLYGRTFNKNSSNYSS